MTSGFIEKPGLPQGRVTAAIIGAKYSSYIHSLEEIRIKSILMPSNPDISANISFHADMSIFHFGNEVFFKTESSSFKPEIMHKYSAYMHIVDKCGINYPEDVRTNACLIGRYLFCNEKGTSKSIIDYAENRGCKIVFVKQGYVKCSICVLDEKHIITDDRSIESAAEKNGFDVLRYDGKEIRLDGYDRGFIGGTCGKVSESEIVFTGRFKTDEIERYANDNGISVKYLSDDAPYDVGSIIPIIEEKTDKES